MSALNTDIPPKNLNWHGWTEGSKVEFFNETKPATRCTCKYEDCGFSYLDELGNPLLYPAAPLCGVW